MARPNKKIPPAATHRVTIRLTDDLYDVVLQDAKNARVSVAEYIRQLILNRTVNPFCRINPYLTLINEKNEARFPGDFVKQNQTRTKRKRPENQLFSGLLIRFNQEIIAC